MTPSAHPAWTLVQGQTIGGFIELRSYLGQFLWMLKTKVISSATGVRMPVAVGFGDGETLSGQAPIVHNGDEL